MSKTRKNKSAEEAAKLFVENIKKKGFIIYMDRLQTACDTLDDPGLGRVFRNINDYVHNPHHLPNFADRGEYVNYQYMVGGIRDNNEEWKEKILKRRLRYENDKQKANIDGNFDNNGNFDKTGEIKNTNLPIKDSTQSSSQSSSQSSTQSSSQSSSQSNLTTTNVVSSQSKKQYQSNFKEIFSNKEYTQNYLNEKKIFLTAEAFEDFFDLNCGYGWPYDAARAARNYIKIHPEAKKAPEKTKKEAPQPPATPPKLQEARDKIWQAIRDQVPAIDYKNWLQPLQLVNITHTTEGDNITLGTKSKFHAEYFAEKIQIMFRQTYFALTSQQVNALECQFVDGNEIKTMQCLTALESAALRKAAAEAKAAEAKADEEASKKRQAAREKSLGNIRANLNPGPNVYAWNSNQDEFSKNIYFEPFKDTPQKLTTETATPKELKPLHAEILEQCKKNISPINYNLYYNTIDLLAVDYYDTDKIDGTRYAELTIGVISQNFIDQFRKDFEKNYATAFKIIKAYEPHIFYKIINPEK